MKAKQKELYKETSIERAIELTSWLRNEIDVMRMKIKSELQELKRLELALRQVQDILFDMQQDELFEEE
jgi:hypothetical protein